MKNYKVTLERCASSVDTLQVKSELKGKEWLKENSQVLKADNKTNKQDYYWLCSVTDEEVVVVIFLDRYELTYEYTR